MDAFARLAEEAEDLDRSVAGGAEPVGHRGVELGDLARPMVMSWSATMSRISPASTYSHS